MEMTKEDAVKKLGLKVFDYALPQRWVNKVMEATGDDPVPHFVWCYDDNSIFGFPRPLTKKGSEIVKKLNKSGWYLEAFEGEVVDEC